MYSVVDNLKTWKELKEFIDGLDDFFLFRGQEDFSWGLKSGIERVTDGVLGDVSEVKYALEIMMLDKLERHKYNIPSFYLNVMSSNIQKIALLQHYGAPTRLLDFTTSPYVALFFAIENAKSDCALFATNRMELLVRNKIYLGLSNPNDDRIRNYERSLSIPAAFDDIIMKQPQYKFTEFIQPYYLFDRIINQSGGFLCQGDIGVSFEENLKNTMSVNMPNSSPFYKIKIPVELKFDILRDLHKMNINRSTLFTGFDGFVQSIANKSLIDIVGSIKMM